MKKLVAKVLGEISKILASFEIKEGGYSARKLSSFFAVMLAGFITVRKVPGNDMLLALIAWLIFGLLCLSVITAEQLIKFKNGDKESTPANSPQDASSASHLN